jgi:Family of unknown function (DUF5335)
MATTTTREIPQAHWQKFFDDFSKQHEKGWFVLLEVEGKDLGDQLETDGLPFLGISYVSQGTGAGSIDIGFGNKPDKFGSHLVDQPRHVYVADTDGGAETDIQIDSADGTKTLVRLRRDKSFPSDDRPG